MEGVHIYNAGRGVAQGHSKYTMQQYYHYPNVEG